MSFASGGRIAKNTILLYARMLIILVITLYTSRVILDALGEDDFGIYNVIGGVVVLFSFLTSALTNATQRYLNYHLGLGEKGNVHKIFNIATLAHFTILLIIFVFAETIGLWFVETQLNLPNERFVAARWVYQMTVIATLLNIMVVPYRSSIIATERMSVFAYISIFEVILRLIVALVLTYVVIDRLIIYSILITIVSLLSYSAYRGICRYTLHFTRFKFEWDKSLFRELLMFSSWYLLGGAAQVGSKQGVNILLNIFFNVGVNAAVGIANQIRNAVFGFVTSFQTAFNPQIVKLYASGEYDKLIILIYRSTKLSYYLLFIISLPVIVFCDRILALWLVEVPEYTVVFSQLVIITSVFEALSTPLWTAIGATGKIKNYQIIVSLIICLDIPIVYFVLKIGYSPMMAFGINIVINFFAYIYRLLYIRKFVNYSILNYLSFVIIPCLYVTFIVSPLAVFVSKFTTSLFSSFFMICMIVFVTVMTIYILGINREERHFLNKQIVAVAKSLKGLIL